MSMGIVPSDAVLLAVQASLVALPRAMPSRFLSHVRRLRGRGWAAVPVVSIVGVIVMIHFVSGTATWLSWLALIAVPILAFVALAWMIHGRWSWGRTLTAAMVTAGLFLLAWRNQSLIPVVEVGTTHRSHDLLVELQHMFFMLGWNRVWHLPGQLAATLLCGLSCIALGVLLASVTPPKWLMAGIVLMSCADVYMIATSLLQAPNNELVAAVPAPGSGLPQLQSESFGVMNMGYGDFFVAGVLGGALAAQRAAVGDDSCKLQLSAALMVFVLAALFDLLFFVFDELPATVPVALTVIIIQVWHWSGRRHVRAPVASDSTLGADAAIITDRV